MGCNTSKETSTTANENESKDQKINEDNQEESKDNHVGTGRRSVVVGSDFFLTFRKHEWLASSEVVCLNAYTLPANHF
ncbi:hypothetical protein HUJ05_004519 [Dendroctonus ponderosae]|nr:hypothetical protein HUJ05_004519 [Dendroctonus ponderosae]